MGVAFRLPNPLINRWRVSPRPAHTFWGRLAYRELVGVVEQQLIARCYQMAVPDKPRLGEWLQLISFVCGALGLFAVGVTAFQDLKDHERRIDKIEESYTRNEGQRNETNERLARIEERLNALLPRRD